MKIILFSILGIFSLNAYCDDEINVDMQTVTCANKYKITSKSTVADITKNCNTEELKNKHGLINKNKGQENISPTDVVGTKTKDRIENQSG
jgi:hypothetical protein